MYRPEPLPLSIWIVNPFDDIPGEGLPPLRYWSLARVLAGRGHDVTWWTAAWSHRRKAPRSTPLLTRHEEGFAVRLVAVRPYTKNVSFARLASHRDFGRTFERLANESIASGQLIPLEFLKPFFEANNPGHADALRMATERHFELGRRVTH